MSQVRIEGPEVDRLRDALGMLDGVCEDLSPEDSERFLLHVAAALCEHAAYSKAGHWSSSNVGELLILAAQIERFATPRQLD